jgi:N-acetylmuramoyl-L-alanine amidase
MKRSLRLKILAGALVSALLLPGVPAAARRTVAQKKAIARTQFEEAERLREALRGKPERARKKSDYQRVMDAYRQVYYTAPTSNRADVSALAVGDLLVDFARAFNDPKSLTDAIGQYEFLRREYPGSRYRMEALFTIAQIYHDDLADNVKAKEVLEEFLRRYPSHDLADAAKEGIADIDREEKEAKLAASGKKPKRTKQQERKLRKPEPEPEPPVETAESDVEAETPVHSQRSRLPVLTSIRHWSTPDYTRVVIDLEGEAKYEAGRVPSPDRIFFDLHDTKLASELVGKSYEVGDGFLKKIRAAQFSLDMTRVVLEVDSLAEYSAFLLPNPYRLIIDIHGKTGERVLTAEASPSAPVVPSERTTTGVREKITDLDAETAEAARPVAGTSSKVPDATRELTESGSALNRRLNRTKETAANTEPKVEVVSPREKKSRRARKEEEPEVRPAQPLLNGDRSLIRALGLKIGKIVIDAGHGGHDTGTVGPNGLQEKDLVLDVATRLGKLLETKLGAEVIYTRDDDTFVPLESRTAIANKNEADLFISVHANSSRDPKARGVETYYLNFTSNPEALEVAARENAVSQKSVYELQDLVKKIALREKIDESREFAADVQKALHSGLAAKAPGMRDRGVKKAPFVVLIGANMPSILAEVSFVSNPQDAKRMTTPGHRQRIAESLYKGVAQYASGLSGVKTAASRLADPTGANTAP